MLKMAKLQSIAQKVGNQFFTGGIDYSSFIVVPPLSGIHLPGDTPYRNPAK